MKTTKEYLLLIFGCIWCFPHLVLYWLHHNKNLVQSDIRAALKSEEKEYSDALGLIHLLTFSKHFRNLFYYRTRPWSPFLRVLCPQMSHLYIRTWKIGGGLCLIHAFSTEIGALSIGTNCTIYQQVTIGGDKHGIPIIGDNVTIYSGAVIVGKVTIGNNVVVGANSTVYIDVPDNSTVLPGSSKVMRWKR
jgi:serine O-acetyltransferase